MKHVDFKKLFDSTIAEIERLAITKGTDYSSEADRLSNFKVNAERTGLTPIQVWAIYAFKHMNAIEAYVRNGQVESEPIESRIDDEILYLILLKALITDASGS